MGVASARWTSGAASWWDGFYADRDKGVPFFVEKALDLGCGPGRNALQLAARGYEVDGVDLSPAAVAWAEERARDRSVEGEVPSVRFYCGDVFALAGAELPGPYDLVYDSGCFHHLPPHRRISYLALLDQVLAPGGYFGLTCFAAGGVGSEVPDVELYRGSGLWSRCGGCGMSRWSRPGSGRGFSGPRCSAGGVEPRQVRGYSQPCWRASRMASMRLRVPVLPIADER